MAGEDRTEVATPKKRTELRRRGQVAKSQDLSSMVVLVGLIICIHAIGGRSLAAVQTFMQTSLGGIRTDALTPQIVFSKGGEMAMVLLHAIGPFLATAMILGVVVNMTQTGFLIAPQALKPDFTRLNPLAGMSRYFSSRGAVETLKSVAKLAIISLIAYSTISGMYPQFLQTNRVEMTATLALIGEALYRVALRITMFLLVLAAADYGYQRWSFEKSIRMTKEEVRQESKNAEGNPQVKARIRARQRQIAKRRMMEQVPKADVVVTNPTHFAVALKYEAGSMAAPQVVAKGADLLAARIRELAVENDVPIVENPPLARALYRTVDVGREIPGDLYAAVAEVLAFVYQINARRAAARG